MELTTLRPRAGYFNFDDLYYRGMDVGALLLQLNQGNNGMATSSSITPITDRYTANASGTGYVAGQIISRTELLDMATTPPTSTVYWYNLTTNAALTVAPAYSTLTLNTNGAATNAELRATPLMVKIDASSPDLALMGGTSDPMAAADGSGVLTVLGALRRMVNTLNSLTARLPVSLGQKTSAGSISVVNASDVWDDDGVTFDVNGNVTQERQTNGTLRRARNWTTTVDGTGARSSSAGAWFSI